MIHVDQKIDSTSPNENTRPTTHNPHQYLDLVRAHYPGVRVGIMHVTVADEAVVQRRVLSRAKEEGRVVPPALVTDSFNQVAGSTGDDSFCLFGWVVGWWACWLVVVVIVVVVAADVLYSVYC